MTREENSIYRLVKRIAYEMNYAKKLPKTTITVRWVLWLKNTLTLRYKDHLVDLGVTSNAAPMTRLTGDALDKAVQWMLEREIAEHMYTIISNPDRLSRCDWIQCLNETHWVLKYFLPFKFKQFNK